MSGQQEESSATLSLQAAMVALLRAERERQRLTQAEVGARMGVGPTFIQKIEYNKGERKINSLERYAEALGVRIRVTLE